MATAFALLPLLSGTVVPPVVAAASFVTLPVLAWGALRYTRTRSPFPTVAGMVLFVVVQLLAWAWVADLYSL